MHRRRQIEPACEMRRRHERRARIGRAPERTIDAVDERGAEAAREPVARQRRGLAERGDAGFAQRGARGVVEIEQRERKRRQRGGQVARDRRPAA